MLVKKYDIKLKHESQFPKPLRNVMTCELKHNAYQDLYKKGEFFDDVDKPRRFMESRLKAIVKAVNTLDQCHKQTLKFLKLQATDEDVILNKKDLQEIFD